MNNLSVGLVLFFIVAFVFNIFAIVEKNDCGEWFRDMLEYNIGVLISVFTLFLPTTIIMGLIYILSIKPFKKKRKDK